MLGALQGPEERLGPFEEGLRFLDRAVLGFLRVLLNSSEKKRVHNMQAFLAMVEVHGVAFGSRRPPKTIGGKALAGILRGSIYPYARGREMDVSGLSESIHERA